VRRPSGWPEWLTAAACALMAAYELSLGKQAGMTHTAMSFYSQHPHVVPLHRAALALDVVFILAVGVWVAKPGWGKALGPALAVMASVGAAMAWSELWLASRLAADSRYVLAGLPLSPLNNLGLLGAQVFLGYLLSAAARASRGARPRASVLLLWMVALGMCQWIAWDVVARPGAG
jgi:hypothetical protein